MRGENPLSFPVRLFPQNIPSFTAYPQNNPRRVKIPQEDISYYTHLPLVPIELKEDTLRATLAFMNRLPPGGIGLNMTALEKLVHAGNFIVPATNATRGDTYEKYIQRTDISSLSTVFTIESSGGETRYRAKPEVGASWLGIDKLSNYSPKFDFLINKLKASEGCVFAYTRFVSGGAIPLALALEANGYTPYGRKSGLLANGIQVPGGKQCALCPKKEKEHGNIDHVFSPAYYGILTGDIKISPHNEETIKVQRAINNAQGVKMKIIIGSQIASEGVDLRFVRETHIIDSWFHLNKTEQILGRAIRFLSHCALEKEKRNNTVYLYTAILPPSENSRETADLYSYRIGFKKAVLIGNVTRTMKQSALDCNINKNAIVIKDQEPIRQIDSQRSVRDDVNINDMPFTAVCDWIETCEYKCKPSISVQDMEYDDSTYDEFSARWRIHKMKERLKKLFSEQSFYQSEDIWNIFSDTPRLAVVDLLNDIIDNKLFQVHYNGISGYIRYCNGYYIFQPNVYTDLTIPLAIRIAKFPIKRDIYTPIEYEIPESIEKEERTIAPTDTTIDLWNAIYKWIHKLSTSQPYVLPPSELQKRRMEISYGDSELLELYLQIFEMIEWFHTSFKKSSNKNENAFTTALLFYFWDEWLTIEEQQYIIYSNTVNVDEYINENQYTLGNNLINRFLDPKTGTVKYICKGNTPCATSTSEYIENDDTDPLKAFRLNTRTTGHIYGFIVPKNGKLTFKTADPPYEGEKVKRGKECGNVSTMTGHIESLIEIGDILKKHNKTDFDLNPGSIRTTRIIKNSTRACTLLNILIRFIDVERFENKRWFFRPLQSYYKGHKATFRTFTKK